MWQFRYTSSWVSSLLSDAWRNLIVTSLLPWQRHGMASCPFISTLHHSPAYTCVSFKNSKYSLWHDFSGYRYKEWTEFTFDFMPFLGVYSFSYITNIYWKPSICQANSCIMIYFQINWKLKRLFFLAEHLCIFICIMWMEKINFKPCVNPWNIWTKYMFTPLFRRLNISLFS